MAQGGPPEKGVIVGFRRTMLALAMTALLAAACAGEDDSGGILLDEQIGAPEEVSETDTIDPDTAETSSVVKQAFVELDVVSDKLDSAAQQVVDIATGPNVGGYLVSSVVDTSEGYGFGEVAVSVPAPRFEHVVSNLNGIGDVTRQQLLGDDVTPEYVTARNKLIAARGRVADLLDRLEQATDAGSKFLLRGKVESARGELRQLEDSSEQIESEASFSTIEVALAGTAPPAATPKPVFERALETAKTILLAIASGIVLAGGVIIPIAALVVVVFLIAAPVIRRLRPRMQN